MAKEIPILFSTTMVQAILRGEKTQTRRRLQYSDEDFFNHPKTEVLIDGNGVAHFQIADVIARTMFAGYKCPYGKAGDILWVREEHYRFGHWEKDNTRTRKSGRQAWKFVADTAEVKYCDNAPAEYRKGRHHADPSTPAWHKRLARFMLKDDVRIFLKHKSTWVERLQDISDGDAISEGIERTADSFKNYNSKDLQRWILKDGLDSPAKVSFMTLWQSINGRESWDSNPWVWVVEYEVLSTTGKPEIL